MQRLIKMFSSCCHDQETNLEVEEPKEEKQNDQTEIQRNQLELKERIQNKKRFSNSGIQTEKEPKVKKRRRKRAESSGVIQKADSGSVISIVNGVGEDSQIEGSSPQPGPREKKPLKGILKKPK